MKKIVAIVIVIFICIFAMLIHTSKDTVKVGETIKFYNEELGTKTWYSQNNNIARVILSEGNECTIMGISKGSTEIIVQTKYNDSPLTGVFVGGKKSDAKVETLSYSIDVTSGAFDKIGELFNGLAKVTKGNKVGFVDENLEIAIPLNFEMKIKDTNEMPFYQFTYGVARVQCKQSDNTNTSTAIINKKGEEIVPPDYSEYSIKEVWTDGKLIYISKVNRKTHNDEYGAYDMNGKIAIPFEIGKGENIEKVRGADWALCIYEERGTPISVLDMGKEMGSNQIGTITIAGTSIKTNVTELNLVGKGIVDISELANLTNIQVLELDANKISDISSLENLKSLTSLSLSANRIDDISYLSKLTGLKKLRLMNNQIADITPLKSLTNLERLSLGDNNIDNINSLSGMKKLQWLVLSGNPITDITVLPKLGRLIEIYLAKTSISDITALSGMTGLNYLSISQNKISDITPLLKLTRLRTLDVYECNLSDQQIGVLKNGLPNCEIKDL